MITVMAVAAGMVLVLQHPQNAGPVRAIHEAFLGMLGDIITQTGMMTREQFELFKRGQFQVEVTVDPGKAMVFGPGSMN